MKLYKPTSAGIRQRAIVEYKKLLSGETAPKKSLTIKLQDRAGRNNRGTITIRHQGGGVKKVYRVVDFMMNKMNVPGRITTIEYDPYRSAFISLVVYKDGDQRYIVTPQNVKVGEEIITAPSAPIKVGNRLQLKNIPIGYQVFGVEVRPYGGATLARSAGSYVEVLGSDADLVISGSVEAFVNVAVERVGLSLLDLETAFRISKTIALSGGSKTVAAIDIAEALQYVSARHGKNLEYIGTI
jgi:large subunit ribosomal protein L2